MEAINEALHPAQREVRRAAHSQDLIEVPKQAKLEREAEGHRLPEQVPAAEVVL